MGVHEGSAARTIRTAGLGRGGSHPHGKVQPAQHWLRRQGFIPVGGHVSAPREPLGWLGGLLQHLISFNAHTLSLRCQKTEGEMESKGKHLIPLNLSHSRQWFPSSDSGLKIS